MAESLLAHLYTHIRGSQEDIATISLQYLLKQSDDLNRAFTKRIADILCIETEDELQYVIQSSGEDRERPDMAGVDSGGAEQVLFEMKFYAALTKNQPVTYLERLIKENGKGLIFICPKSRINTLWSTLKAHCCEKKMVIINNRCVKVDSVNMAITTWGEVIEHLSRIAAATANQYLSDIEQLRGYCAQMDSDAFIPFTEDDLTAEVAKKAERYYTVVDKVTDLLLCDENLVSSKKGLKATANRDGYISYLYVDGYALGICYDRFLWGTDSSIETPFWLLIKTVDADNNNRWEQKRELVEKLKKYPERMKEEYARTYYLALEVPTNVTEDEVCESIKEQILMYLEDMNND